MSETPQQASSRLVQEYGLAERAAEFVDGRLQEQLARALARGHGDHSEDRARKMERRHLLR